MAKNFDTGLITSGVFGSAQELSQQELRPGGRAGGGGDGVIAKGNHRAPGGPFICGAGGHFDGSSCGAWGRSGESSELGSEELTHLRSPLKQAWISWTSIRALLSYKTGSSTYVNLYRLHRLRNFGSPALKQNT